MLHFNGETAIPILLAFLEEHETLEARTAEWATEK